MLNLPCPLDKAGSAWDHAAFTWPRVLACGLPTAQAMLCHAHSGKAVHAGSSQIHRNHLEAAEQQLKAHWCQWPGGNNTIHVALLLTHHLCVARPDSAQHSAAVHRTERGADILQQYRMGRATPRGEIMQIQIHAHSSLDKLVSSVQCTQGPCC